MSTQALVEAPSRSSPTSRAIPEIEYRPREHQRHTSTTACGGSTFSSAISRFGKTVLCINSLIAAALRCKRQNPRFTYVAPLLTQARMAMVVYLKHYAMAGAGRRGARNGESRRFPRWRAGAAVRR